MLERIFRRNRTRTTPGVPPRDDHVPPRRSQAGLDEKQIVDSKAVEMGDDDPRPRWEYIPIIIPPTADLVASLNKAGKDGWEIIAAVSQTEQGTLWLAKRRKRKLIDASPNEQHRILAAR